jgi:hypothetical protein
MSRADNVNTSESSYANDAMTRLWRNADDRETGAEAVEALRARRQAQREADSQKQGGGWRLRRARKR